MMQEKSRKQAKEQWTTALDSFTDYVWKHDDIVASVGLALVIVLLFKLTCVLTLT